MEKVVIYSATANLYQPVLGSIKSLLDTTPIDKIYLLTETAIYPYELSSKVIVQQMHPLDYLSPLDANWNCDCTYAVLLRLAYAKIFTESQVLSLDCDTIVQQDISSLWDCPLRQDEYIAAVSKPFNQKPGIFNIQAAVMMLHLEAWRQSGIDNQMLQAIANKVYSEAEQDCLTEFCQNHIRRLDWKYNYFLHYRNWSPYPAIIHYGSIAGEDPMKRYSESPTMISWQQKSWNEIRYK